MHKIVILDGYTTNPGDLSWEGFEKHGQLTVYDRTPDDLIQARIGDADIVYTNKTPITRETIESCPNLRFIGLLSTGYNVVDLRAARERGIPISNVPSYSTMAVAQFAMALLLEICHNVAQHSKAVHAGRWEHSKDFTFWDYPQIELDGKTMGIIGYGSIGRAVARMAQGMGMKILAHTPHPDKSLESDTLRFVGLDELYAQSDVVSLHCPLFPETAGMINRDSIAKMKDGVILLNNSRGGLIDEQALADALDSGKVYAAGVDVVSVEPIKPDNPLLAAKNCFITPHISWAPRASRARLVDIAAGNLAQFLAGTPQNVVNP